MSVQVVYNVCYQAKQRHVYLSNSSIQKVVDTIYKKNKEQHLKETKKIFAGKYGIEYFSEHDVTQDPEDRYLIKEAIEKFEKKCIKELEDHSIFIARKHRLDYALSCMIKLLEDSR